MPRRTKTTDEELSRDEAQLVLDWLVDEKKYPTPKRGKFHLLHRTPADVANEYKVKTEEVITASRRKVAEPA